MDYRFCQKIELCRLYCNWFRQFKLKKIARKLLRPDHLSTTNLSPHYTLENFKKRDLVEYTILLAQQVLSEKKTVKCLKILKKKIILFLQFVELINFFFIKRKKFFPHIQESKKNRRLQIY